VTHPVRFRVDDDLRRSRLTVFLRLVLAIPHLVWLTIWTYAILLVLVFQWLATLFAGRMEEDVHGFMGRFARYNVHVYSYVFLVANPYPRFRGLPGTYPVDLELDPPERQNRWTVLLRIVLAIPAYAFAIVLGTVVYVVALLGWFAALALGRMPQGLRDLAAYGLRYQAQTYAYLMLLTQRYPSLAGGTTGVEHERIGAPAAEAADVDGPFS
jgi:hypothetical protein